MPTAFAFNNEAAAGERQRAQMEAQGYYAEDFQRSACSGTTISISGSVYYMSIGLAVGDRVTNIHVMTQGSAATYSGVGQRFGVYSKAGVLLASTGDVSALFTAGNNPRVVPLTLQSDGTVFSVPATDGYYIAALGIATTMPTMQRGALSFNGSGVFGSAIQAAYGVQTGQTDLPATATIAVNSTQIPYWVGVS